MAARGSDKGYRTIILPGENAGQTPKPESSRAGFLRPRFLPTEDSLGSIELGSRSEYELEGEFEWRGEYFERPPDLSNLSPSKGMHSTDSHQIQS